MKTKIFYVLSVALIATLACGTTSFPAPDPTAALPQSAPPTEAVFTPIPTLTPDVGPDFSSRSLTLNSTPFNESGNGPIYTITAQIPQLQGSNDARVTAFNAHLNEIVKDQVDSFRSDVLANQPVVPFVAGSSFDVRYELISQRDNVWSIKFSIMSFMDGAAHPNHYSLTVNYDVLLGRELTFDDLFFAGANYLQAISDYCKAELSKRDIGFTDPIFQTGADPLPENYRNWNLSNDGLLITFDPYQVAPYAAGTQTVVIPYVDLRPVSNVNGVLQIFDR
jgi:hypothetical protein